MSGADAAAGGDCEGARPRAPDTHVCVFAKPPRPGRSKTRLAPAVGEAGAAALADAFLRDTLAQVRSLSWATPVLATTEPVATARPPDGFELWQQGDGDLGARLERVARRALARAGAVIAVGADSPGLPRRLYEQARAALAEADAVLGPSEDGGFYLLGLRRCPEGILSNLPWSRADTFAATVGRLRASGLRTVVLEPWFDIDRPEDLRRMRALLWSKTLSAPATARVLAPRISIVIPVLDEERRIEAQLGALATSPGYHEIIAVDGGSTDRTRELAGRFPVRLVDAPRGRARQLNAGAAVAEGDVILFLHADVALPDDAPHHVADALADPAVVAGAFRTWTVPDPGQRCWFAPLLHLADVRSRYTRLPYGDQAVFVRAETVRAVGGFPELSLMEDLAFARRLRRHGRIRTVRARVRVSGRRFIARPVGYTVAVNVFPILYRLGVPPPLLARFYGDVR
jgi:uncharacterized protein